MRAPAGSAPDGGPSWKEAAAVLALMAMFAALVLFRFHSPGQIDDAMRNEVDAVLLGEEVAEALPFSYAKYPSHLYHGRTTVYLMAPYYYLFGRGWTQTRLWPFLFGLLTVALTYLFVRRAFGVRAALLAALLLVVHPPFFMGVKNGAWHVSYMLFFSVAALHLFYRWWETGSLWRAALAAFLLGVGLGTRLWFVWFIIALAASGLFVIKTLWSKPLRRSPARAAAFAAAVLAGFLLGGSPILYTELSFQKGFSLQRIAEERGRAQQYPTFGLRSAAAGFHNVLSGRLFFYVFFERNGGSTPNPLYPVLAAGSALWAAAGIFRRPRRPTPLPWVLSIFLGIFLLGCFSPKPPGHHFFIIYPLPQILIAVAFVQLAAALRGKRARWAVLAAFLTLLAGEARAVGRYVGLIRRVGGIGLSSDAIHSVAAEMGRADPAERVHYVLPYYLACQLFLGYPELDINFRDDCRDSCMDKLFPDLRASQPRPSTAGSLTEVVEGARADQAGPRHPSEPPDFWKSWVWIAWENMLKERKPSSVVFVVNTSGGFPDERAFLYWMARWAAARNRPLTLWKELRDGDGTVPFHLYRLDLSRNGP